MHVSAAKSDVLTDLRRRAGRFQGHLSNPASQAAHETLQGQIALIERTPGDTMADVQSSLRNQAAVMGQQRNRQLAASALMLGGLATSLIINHGPTANALIGGANVACLFGGLIIGGLSLDKEEKRRSLLGSADTLGALSPGSYSGNGNLVSQPNTLDLSGPATVMQLRGLLEATQTSLQSQQGPEFAAAGEQVKKDKKNLSRYAGITLDDLRQTAQAREDRVKSLTKLPLWGMGVGFATCFGGCLHWGFAAAGMGVILATLGTAIACSTVRHNAREVNETLDRWEPQLQILKDVHNAGAEMRDWKTSGAGVGVKSDQFSVVVGGVRVAVRPRD